MPKYKAKVRGFIDNNKRMVERGEVFNYDGKPGKWMEPVAEDSKPGKPAAKSDPNSNGPTPKKDDKGPGKPAAKKEE
jgi:hypothetical protein